MSHSPNLPDSPIFDLAQLSDWCGVRPGMTRAEVVAALGSRGVEAEAYGEDNLTATTDEWELEMYFATDGSERLRQVSIEGEAVCWNGQPMLGAGLERVLRAMEPIGPALWEANDVTGEPFPAPKEPPAEPVTDEALLEEGTLWLAQRRLGLVLGNGEVMAVAWREPQDFPREFAGPLTEAQRELSQRPNLDDYLSAKRLERIRVVRAKDPLTPWRTLLTVLLMAALVAVGKRGFQEGQKWSQAETQQAKFVALEQVPMTQFRDYLPPGLRWMFPKMRAVLAEGYRVAYVDHQEHRREAVLERGELYVWPREVGEEVPIAYVDGDPPQVKGLSRARDVGFLEFMPWAIALGVLYLLALGVLYGVGRVVRGLGRAGRR